MTNPTNPFVSVLLRCCKCGHRTRMFTCPKCGHHLCTSCK